MLSNKSLRKYSNTVAVDINTELEDEKAKEKCI